LPLGKQLVSFRNSEIIPQRFNDDIEEIRVGHMVRAPLPFLL